MSARQGTAVDGGLRLDHHPPEYLQHERALAAFGAHTHGCIDAHRARYAGRQPPRGLRNHLCERAFHGDAAGVLPRLLAAGLGPHTPDDAGFSALQVAGFFRAARVVADLRAVGE
jgi:hypothetical protein